jgi:formylglycine-generating enzyme required for sulfatase activity
MANHSKYQNASGEHAHVQPIIYRIFLASPGDVQDERMLARVATDQVRGELAFRDRINLQCIAWDQPGVEVAMEAGLTPQEAIKRGLPNPSECDLVVVILWSRMGTPLPADYTKPDGTAYLSGTEWEYLDAMREARSSGRPVVWLYRRTQIPSLNLEDPEFDDKHLQWKKVKSFFQALEAKDGSLTAGVNRYQAPDEFRRQFEQHLRDRLTKVLQESSDRGPTVPFAQEHEIEESPYWTDTPYPGLEAFKPGQAPIFFGRGAEVDQLLEVLRDPEISFTSVVGASGSGKSSLVAAGLIPRLRAGALPGSAHWIDITFKPGERGGDPFLALAYALKAVLGTTGEREAELACDLRAEPDCFISHVSDLLRSRPQGARLLLVVDQFEELFTLAPADKRADFIELMETIVRTRKVRVIVTMRVDFLPYAVEIPPLAELLRGRGFFSVSAPGFLALTEMIRRPALVAGLEIRDDLCERILKDTGTGSGALALMAFTLHEVYERGKQSGRLTLQDYEKMGGVAGAIQAQAEKALKPLLDKNDRGLQVLHALFLDLVEVNDQGIAARRRALVELIRRDVTKARFMDALVDARILVTEMEGSDNPTLEVAHEAVFSAWPRMSRWVEAHSGELRTCRRLSRAANDWKEAEAPLFSQLPDRATLKQYRKVLPSCSLGGDADVVRRFLHAARLRQRLWGVFGLLVVLGFGTLGVHIGLQNRAMSWNVLSWNMLSIWSLAKLGLYEGPAMLELPGGPFQMGSSGCIPDDKKVECPRHEVTIQHFWMGKYEVTFDEYSAFVLDGNGVKLPDDSGFGRGSRPVINVSWDEARAYAAWLSKVTGARFRLPTEAEWEYAARAGTETEYWWGNDARKEGGVWANCAECGVEDGGKKTAPVGSFPANFFKLHDMHGNASEWVEDDWHDSYWGAPDDGNPWIDDPRPSKRVFRGGSWHGVADLSRSAYRNYDYPDRGDGLGFRLSRSVAPGP